MNINETKSQNEQGPDLVDFCTATFIISVEEIVNAYKCNQKQFSTSDIWNIQKQKRQLAIGPKIVITGQ
jgi:hypothetical protein